MSVLEMAIAGHRDNPEVPLNFDAPVRTTRGERSDFGSDEAYATYLEGKRQDEENGFITVPLGEAPPEGYGNAPISMEVVDRSTGRKETVHHPLLHQHVPMPQKLNDVLDSGNVEEVAACIIRDGHVNSVWGSRVDRDFFGISTLMYACSNGHQPVVDLLLEHRANVNVQTSCGGTALMTAAFNGHPSIVLSLLRAGAHSHIKSHIGNNALQVAAHFMNESKGHFECERILREDARTKNLTPFTRLFVSYAAEPEWAGQPPFYSWLQCAYETRRYYSPAAAAQAPDLSVVPAGGLVPTHRGQALLGEARIFTDRDPDDAPAKSALQRAEDEVRRRARLQNQKPNAPCQCGSGKKFKKCCGALKTKGDPNIKDPKAMQVMGPPFNAGQGGGLTGAYNPDGSVSESALMVKLLATGEIVRMPIRLLSSESMEHHQASAPFKQAREIEEEMRAAKERLTLAGQGGRP